MTVRELIVTILVTRFGPGNTFRVFYEIDREDRKVYILAIGIKERDRLFIGGEEVEL